MPKSVNDYYAEKMKRLLELQKQEEDSRLSGRPMTLAAPSDQLSIETRGHGYYNSFRTKSREQRTGAAEAGERPLGTAPGHAPRPVRTVGSDASRLSAAAPHTRTGGANTGAVGTDAGAGAAPRGSGPNSGARARISPDDIYENARRRTEQQKAEEEKRRALDEKRKRENAAARAAEKKTYESPHANVGTPGQAVDGAGQSARGRSAGSARNARGVNGGASFEQTEADKRRERAAKQEALEKAKRARRLRKIRDAVISFVLILAVFAVMCIVVYRLLFVISDISVDGSENYSADEIIAASGVAEGDHLYSFRASSTEQSIILRCPLVSSVRVKRSAPRKVTFQITEEKSTYYADFYGEYRAMSSDLRVLYSVTRDEAREQGLVLLKLPAVSKAVSGTAAQYSSVRRDSYIYDTVKALSESELWGRIGAVDLTGKYDIKMVCDGKYLLSFGDSGSADSKLRIAAAVLKDDMFSGDDKAKIDLTNLAQTGVVVDNRLELDW